MPAVARKQIGRPEEPVEHREGAAGKSAFIRGTRVRVADIAQLYILLQQEVVVERILRSLPHLTPEQVHAALEYWRAHKEEIGLEIAADEEAVANLQSA